jgi:ATP-dependent RNA helicase DHX57
MTDFAFRRLLDAQMLRCVNEGTILDVGANNPIIEAMTALLANDGLSE